MFMLTRSRYSYRFPCHTRCLHTGIRATNRPFQKSVTRRIAIISATAISIYAIDELYYASLLQRSARAVYVLLWVAYQYSRNIDKYDSINDLHEIASEKLFAMIEKNKGLYIKQGQAVANQASVFPVAYQKRFSGLYDAAPQDLWSDVDRVLRKNLGSDYETQIFEYIEHDPIASASIAQVHRAKLKDEQTLVAVKVQHPYISKQVAVDLAVYRGISWVYSRLFDLPLSFFTRYISDQIIKEADFRIEAAHSERIAKLLREDKALDNLCFHIPATYNMYTRKQVLVSEWIDGVSLADKNKLVDAKFNLTTLMSQYLNLFGRQIFEYGFVHSDPHPGNLLARFHKGKQQLVLLDHGLYVSLSPKFQSEYCELWKYLFCFDQKSIERIAEEWGVGSTDLLSTIVQLRPPKNADLSKSRNSLDLIRSLLGDEAKFPLELLFILRTMRMMQNLNQSMGSPVNRVNLLTNSAIQLSHRTKLDLTHRATWLQILQIRFGLFFSDVVFWFLRLRQLILGRFYGTTGKGLEDYIDAYMKETARSFGLEFAEEVPV